MRGIHGTGPLVDSDLAAATGLECPHQLEADHLQERQERHDEERLRAVAIGKQIVEARCSLCHAEGKGGAPRMGDRAAWIPRLSQGFEKTVRSAINGHGGMPARGGLPDLTDHEIRGAIAYMLNPDPPLKN